MVFEVTFLDSRLRGNDEVYIEIVINNLFPERFLGRALRT